MFVSLMSVSLTYLYIFWLHLVARVTLGSLTRDQTYPPAMECRVVTTGPPGKSQSPSLFLMWLTLVEVCIEFVTVLLLFYVLVFWLWSMWNQWLIIPFFWLLSPNPLTLSYLHIYVESSGKWYWFYLYYLSKIWLLLPYSLLLPWTKSQPSSVGFLK